MSIIEPKIRTDQNIALKKMADLCVIKLCIKNNKKKNIKNNERKNTTKFVICTTEAIPSARLLEESILLLGEV